MNDSIVPSVLSVSEHLNQSVLVAVSVTVAAPLLGAIVSSLGFGRRSPRLLAVTAAAISLVSSLAITVLWSLSDGRPIGYGAHMGGGRLLFVDG